MSLASSFLEHGVHCTVNHEQLNQAINTSNDQSEILRIVQVMQIASGSTDRQEQLVQYNVMKKDPEQVSFLPMTKGWQVTTMYNYCIG